MKILKCGEVPEVPDRFRCPICGDKLVMEIDEWEQMDDGTWKAGDCGVHINCVSEPEIDDEDWEDWFSGHWSMPYVDWLPLENRVVAWMDKNYRFEGVE